MAACMIAVASNLDYARGGYGTSLTNLRGGDRGTVSCTAHDAFGHQLECYKLPHDRQVMYICTLYRVTVYVTYHCCEGWRKCKDRILCNDCSHCDCNYDAHPVTLNYYFYSPVQADANSQADDFIQEMSQDGSTVSVKDPFIDIVNAPTEVTETECIDNSANTTCLPETGLCPTLVAS